MYTDKLELFELASSLPSVLPSIVDWKKIDNLSIPDFILCTTIKNIFQYLVQLCDIKIL